MRLIDPSSGRVLVEAKEASRIAARVRGLLGSPKLPPGTGMLLRGKQVHTFGMRFPIDAVYLDRHGSVLKVARLVPGRLGPLVWRARWVLELEADRAASLGLRPGSRLAFQR